MSMPTAFAVILLSLLSVSFISATSYNNRFKLITALLTNTPEDFRRLVNPNDITTVWVNVSLVQIVQFDPVAQTFTCEITSNITWNDPKLTWNPAEYGNIYDISLPAAELWIPEIVYTYSFSESDLWQFSVYINSSGTVSILFPDSITSDCDHITYHGYPVDSFSCSFSYWTWYYNQSELLVRYTGADVSNYRDNDIWILDEFKGQDVTFKDQVESDRYYSGSKFTIRAHSSSETLSFILFDFPLIFINIFCVLSFLIPSDSEEKIKVLGLVFIALIAHMCVIQKTLSIGILSPVIHYLLIATIVQVVLTILTSVVLLDIHYTGQNHNKYQVPQCLKTVVLKKLSRLLGLYQALISPSLFKERIDPVVAQFTVMPDDEFEYFLKHGRPYTNLGENDASSSDEEDEKKKKPKIKKNKVFVDPLLAKYESYENVCQGSTVSETYNDKTTCKRMVLIPKQNLKLHFDTLLYRILRAVQHFPLRWAKKTQEDVVMAEWRQTAMVISYLVFYLSALYTGIIWIVCFTI